MTVVIKIIGLADRHGASPFDGQFVRDFDPSRDGVDPFGNLMLAHLTAVADPRLAHHYLSVADAHAEWVRIDSREPVRTDGKPNRPLTAFTVQIMNLDQAIKEFDK